MPQAGPHRLGRAGSLLLGALASLLTACAQPLAPEPPLLVWGERHDNTLHHRERLQRLDALLATGQRPALLMEHFDLDRQAQIDATRAAGGDAAAIVAAAGGKGWPWPDLQPFVERALRFDLPLVAVNVSREQARVLMREGLAANGYAGHAGLQAQAAEIIQRSHCNALPPEAAQRMALAQVARDQAMARALERHAARGAVLLTGNGHARRDLGVAQWLSAPLQQRLRVSLWLEEGEPAPPAAAYDDTRRTAATARPDPCAGVAPAAAPAVSR